MKSFQKYGSILALLLCFASGRTAAQEKIAVENVHGEILMGEEMTKKQAREAALKSAMAEAIRRAAGITVTAEQSRWQSEQQNGAETKTFDLFSSAHRTTAIGKILESTVVREGIENVPVPGMALQQKYFVTINAVVLKEEGNTDPSFTTELKLKQDVFFCRGSIRKNDEVIAEITSTKDGFVTMFGLSNDTVRILLPNGYITDNSIRANRPYVFPNDDWRNKGFRMKVGLPEGEVSAAEMIVAIVTKYPVRFTAMKNENGFGMLPSYTSAYQELTQWLVNIPADQRSESSAAFQIKKME